MDRQALSLIVRCPDGAEAIAALWYELSRNRDDVDALAEASVRLADQRVLAAAITALANTGLPRATRRIAIRVILAQYAPDLTVNEQVWSDPEHAILTGTASLTQRRGEDSIGTDERRRIADVFGVLEKTDPDQLIRRVAKRIAKDLGARSFELPPAYPWKGFGRIGCYAGAGLNRMVTSDTLLPDAAIAAARGPWLVIDSLTRSELHAAGYLDSLITPSDIYPAKLLERRDTVMVTFGVFRRVTPDSIEFDEGSTFPPVNWHFRITPEGLVGKGVLVHDMVVRGADGKDEIPVSRWTVRARRIDCAKVPVIHAWWVPDE